MVAHTVNADDCRVGVLVFNQGCNRADTNAHRANKDKSIKFFPSLGDLGSFDDLGLEFLLERYGHITAFLAHGNDGYLLHFNCHFFKTTNFANYTKNFFSRVRVIRSFCFCISVSLSGYCHSG